MLETTSTAASAGATAPAASERRSALAALSADWLRGYGFVLVVYIAATYFTDVVNMGDTGGYANLIMTSTFSDLLSDFGHLLWVILGRLLSGVVNAFTDADPRMNIIFILLALGWMAGLLSAWLVYNLAYRVARRKWVAAWAAVVFIFSQGFLNFAQTGCAYVPGLSMILSGVWLLFREEDRRNHPPTSGIAAGAAFAAGVGFWAPYILSIPALLVSSLLIFGVSGWRLRVVVRAGFTFAIICTAFYGSAAALQGIHDFAGLKDWTLSAGQTITHIGGFSRMVFGFARTFINMGNDGVLFKRFLLHDPYNAVSLLDLFRLSLGKLLFFYLLFGLWAVALLRSEKGRRFFGFLALAAVPVIGFAWHWQGGDLERYLPLYPAIFLALAHLLSEGRWLILSRLTAAAWLIAVVYINGSTMAATRSLGRQERVVARINELQPLWKPESRIATVLIQDDLFKFPETFFFHPLNRDGILGDRGPGRGIVFDIADRGGSDSPLWRQAFAKRALSIWSAGGDLWISKRAFSPRPAADSAWVEGDDPRISWRDIHEFFSQLETGASVGGADGFFLLPPSSGNRQFLTRWMGS
ncbi:MAG TPA: hypothetical protein VGL11_20700 [Candidatus Binatia bacterium]|jgi:hypothetical protein